MITASDLTNNDFLKLSFHSLSDETYSLFIDFVSYIEKKLLFGIKDLGCFTQIYMLLNEVDVHQYNINVHSYLDAKPYNKDIDHIIAEPEPLRGLVFPQVQAACKDYFAYFNWEVDFIKNFDDKAKKVTLMIIFLVKAQKTSPAYAQNNFATGNYSIAGGKKDFVKQPSFTKSVNKEAKSTTPVIDFEKDNYKHLEI